MALAAGFSCILAFICIVGLVVGGLMVFFSFKFQDTHKVIAVILAVIGLILILIGLPSTIFFISGVFSILSYTN